MRAIWTGMAKSLGVDIVAAADKPKPMTRDEFERMVKATGGMIQGVGPRHG